MFELFSSTPPDTTSFADLQAQIIRHYQSTNADIISSVENKNEYSTQVDHFQNALSSAFLQQSSSSSSFINSFYTPTPIFVPSISYLLNNEGKICLPFEIGDFMFAYPENQFLPTDPSHPSHDTRLCVPCTEGNLKTTVSSCQSHLVVAPVRCLATYDALWRVPRGRTKHALEADIKPQTEIDDIVWIPCESAWVDGRQQFWILFGSAFVVSIFAGLFVRIRFDAAQQQVLRKLNPVSIALE